MAIMARPCCGLLRSALMTSVTAVITLPFCAGYLTILPAATAGAVRRCRARWTCCRSTVLRRTLTLRLGRAALTRLTLSGLRLLGTAATTLTTIAATTTATAAQLNRLRFGLGIGFEAGDDFDRDFTFDEAFDIEQHVAFVDAHQRHGRAACAGTAGTADAVDIVFGN